MVALEPAALVVAVRPPNDEPAAMLVPPSAATEVIQPEPVPMDVLRTVTEAGVVPDVVVDDSNQQPPELRVERATGIEPA